METILFILLWLTQSSEMDSSKFCLQVTHTESMKGLLLSLWSFLWESLADFEWLEKSRKDDCLGVLRWGGSGPGINILTCANSYCMVWTSHWCQKSTLRLSYQLAQILQQGRRSDRLETCQEFNIKNRIKLLQLTPEDLLISELYHV